MLRPMKPALLGGNGRFKEVHIERQAKCGIVGNIYKGRVTRVLPGMQSAFVDIGLEKAAFLHASDIVSHTECVDVNEQKQFRAKTISELVREGQDIVVQSGKRSVGHQRGKINHRYYIAFSLSCLYAGK